ncbi:PadR family transcriptional regulator [Actinomadura sp. 3N407]|uniref:PadR family transcriptional regulator n=1 Tax=Actinomadura sp. 3N407 TaxID=3457423 RepID=UPI003FCCD865
MSLRYAALALLSAQPMTGYELVRYFDDTVGLMWAASDSQIYPELRRMERDGLVRAKTVPRGERAAKRQYKITAKGREALRTWVSTPIPYPPQRDVHRLQITYGELAGLSEARALLTQHLDHYTLRRHQWSTLLDTIKTARFPLLRRRLEGTPPEMHSRILAFKELALEGQVAHADNEIAWARRGLKLIDELEAAEAEEPDLRADLRE